MPSAHHSITLTSDQHFGRRLPPAALCKALAGIPGIVRAAISMAFRGRSGIRGKAPGWLSAASDVRFLGHEGADASVLHFEVPHLGEAAAELYQQGELWPTRPNPQDTGFDLWCDILADVDAGNENSDRFDPALLRRLAHFQGVFGPFQEMLINAHRYPADHPGRLTANTLATADRIRSSTPNPQRVRLAGILDMIRASTQSFALRLDDGQEVRGVLVAGRIEDLAPLFRQRVLVFGRAVYRPSGQLLRVDADDFLPSLGNDAFFSKVPPPVAATSHWRGEIRAQQGKRGLAAIVGQWPGDETDEEIEAALKELS